MTLCPVVLRSGEATRRKTLFKFWQETLKGLFSLCCGCSGYDGRSQKSMLCFGSYNQSLIITWLCTDLQTNLSYLDVSFLDIHHLFVKSAFTSVAELIWTCQSMMRPTDRTCYLLHHITRRKSIKVTSMEQRDLSNIFMTNTFFLTSLNFNSDSRQFSKLLER